VKSNNQLLKIGLIIGVCLGAIYGCFAAFSGSSGYWKNLDFPFPIANIVYIDAADRIWVETADQDLYTISFHCSKEPCWEKASSLPDYSDRESWGKEYQFQFVEDCAFEHLTYPLFQQTKKCASANSQFPEGEIWIYLTLTKSGNLYYWQGSSGLYDMLGILIFPLFFAFIGLVPGSILGILLVGIRKLKSNRK
jgi:hypothetical protein